MTKFPTQGVWGKNERKRWAIFGVKPGEVITGDLIRYLRVVHALGGFIRGPEDVRLRTTKVVQSSIDLKNLAFGPSGDLVLADDCATDPYAVGGIGQVTDGGLASG